MKRKIDFEIDPYGVDFTKCLRVKQLNGPLTLTLKALRGNLKFLQI
jgi:hypothetical protein